MRASLADVRDAPWRRTLPPCVVVRSGRPAAGPGARPARRAGAAARRAGGRRPGRPGAGRPVGRAAHRRRPAGRRGDRSPCPRDLPLGWHTLVAVGRTPAYARGARVPLVVTPDRLELPAAGGRRPADLGPDDPALLGAVPPVLGARRPRRPRRAGPLERRGAGRRLRPGQPAARAVADGAGRALAVPAGDPPVRQPAVHAGRAGAGARLPDRRGAGRDRAHRAAAARDERRRRR